MYIKMQVGKEEEKLEHTNAGDSISGSFPSTIKHILSSVLTGATLRPHI